MRRVGVMLVVVMLLTTACAEDGAAEPNTPTTMPAAIDEPTPQAVGTTGAATSAAVETTTTSLAPETATTAVPSGTSAGFRCPDLYGEDAEPPERSEGMLDAWALPGAEAMWQIPLGSRIPSWAVWSDVVILGFPDGALVGLDVATCEAAWSIRVQGGIENLAVTEQGMILTVSGDTIAAFSGPGFGAWRHQAPGSVFRFAGENNGISVFVDQFGELTGIDTGGDDVFQWFDAANPLAVAVSESFVYRSTGAEVAARPVSGGDVAWVAAIAGVTALFAVPGLLIARDAESLHAFRPQSGEVVWSIPFAGEIGTPLVLDHGELHVASSEETIGFDTVWHLDPADGSTLARATAPDGTEWFPEMDDALVLQIGEDGIVTAMTLFEEPRWAVDTGANRVDRFTEAEIARSSIVVTLTFSSERF